VDTGAAQSAPLSATEKALATQAVALFREGRTREQIATALGLDYVRIGQVVTYGLNPFRKPEEKKEQPQ
jgi:hypothetical protein